MIILDTNAVNGLDPHGSRADLIRMLRKAGLSIAVPWVVREELTAHKLHDYQRAFDQMLRGHRALASLEPNLAGIPPKFEGDRFAAFWRQQYSQVFSTIPTEHSALQAAVLREAACLKPAKVDASKKSGGRDVAVWFSILEYMEKHPGEHVHFVTNNTKDFGNPGEWPFPLDLDLAGRSDRITQLLDFEEVLKEFTQEEEASDEVNAALAQRLSTARSVKIMTREAWNSLWGKAHTRRTPGEVRIKVAADSMAPAECRRIGETTWYWAKATWQVYMYSKGGAQPLIALWDTSILFPADTNEPISLLRSGVFTRLSVAELDKDMQKSLAEDMRALETEAIVTRDDLRGSISGPESKSRSSQSALHYTHEVGLAFSDLGYDVSHEPGDRGVDLKVYTHDGTIAVCIKAGSGILGLVDAITASEVPQEAGDAVLIVTSRTVSRNIEAYLRTVEREDTRPFGTFEWSGPWDNEQLANKVHSLTSSII